MVDYLVVGLGLAGGCFCEVLRRNGKSFKVISDDSQQASKIAGGLYNPVILKRFTLAWEADEQMTIAARFYEAFESELKVKLDHKIPILRRFASIEEQNRWFEASDKSGLNQFLSPKIIQNQNSAIDAPFGYGEVLQTGRVDTKVLLATLKRNLKEKGQLLEESFDYAELIPQNNSVTYKSIGAKQIVFAEGFGLNGNPFFGYLPLNGTKGELLTIKAPELQEANVIKASVFSIPLGDDLYRIGATYKWKDKTNIPTDSSKNELLKKLERLIKCDFEVVDHVAGIRPTVTDRKPLVGVHPIYKNLYVLNGFGSRGVLIAPYASKQLFLHIEQQKPINQEMDIARFEAKFVHS